MTAEQKLARIAEFVKANYSKSKLKSYLDNLDDESFTVNDAAGGNMDDAYSMGWEHAEAYTLSVIKSYLEAE